MEGHFLEVHCVSALSLHLSQNGRSSRTQYTSHFPYGTRMMIMGGWMDGWMGGWMECGNNNEGFININHHEKE